MERCIALAFDIERSGATDKQDTIAIGASVVNEKLEELDSLFLQGYVPYKGRDSNRLTQIIRQLLTFDKERDYTIFEPRCWDEFWSKHEDKLKQLQYHGERSYISRQEEMIREFQKFRRKWENYASENSIKYYLVSDNKVFDGGFINQMIFRHLPNEMPIPYRASDGKYSSFCETHSMMRGLLMSADPGYKLEWGFFKRIGEIYYFPESAKKHDHRPDNDAYTIAYEFQILRGIQAGVYRRKNWEISD